MFPKLAKVSEEQYRPDISVQGKGYITICVARNSRATNVYWQLVDPDFSLLELGFEWPSGRLINCAVSLFNGEVEDCQNQTPPQGNPGTPMFDLSPWPLQVSEREVRGSHIKQPGRIRLLKKHKGVSIVCQEGFPLRSVEYGGKLVCDFGGGNELLALSLVGDFPL